MSFQNGFLSAEITNTFRVKCPINRYSNYINLPKPETLSDCVSTADGTLLLNMPSEKQRSLFWGREGMYFAFYFPIFIKRIWNIGRKKKIQKKVS